MSEQFSIRKGDFRIFETAAAFHIEHIPTRVGRTMGDMVGSYIHDVGTPEFYVNLLTDFMVSTDTFIEAYFGAPCLNYEGWERSWCIAGDDMPCPECSKYEVETHEHTTSCSWCGWEAENQVAMDNDAEAAEDWGDDTEEDGQE